MKPYTLKWWLVQYDKADHLASWYVSIDQIKGGRENYPKYRRYLDLKEWIKQRIIKKYGE